MIDKSLLSGTTRLPELLTPQDIANVLAVKPQGVAINRVTTSVRVYHECQNFRPHTVEAVSTRPLENLQQAVFRYYLVTNEWMKLNYDWLPPGIVGEIIIKNVEGGRTQARVSPEQAKLAAESIVLIGVREPRRDFVVRPKGVPFIAEKYEVEELWLCAPNTPVNIEVTVLPR